MAKSKQREMTLFRFLDIESPIHKLWAGTKIIVMVLVTTTATVTVSWKVLGIFFAFLLLVWLVSKVPLNATPRIPMWFVGFILISGIATGIATGGKPIVKMNHIAIQLGGVELFLQFLAFTLEILVTLMLVGWTSRLGEVSDSLATLLGPLKRIGFPTTELVNTIALSIRGVPLVTEELKMIAASEKQRRKHKPAFDDANSVRDVFREGIDLVVSALASSLRRAQEMGEAMVARGGYGESVGLDTRPSKRDFVAIVVSLIFCVLMVVFQ